MNQYPFNECPRYDRCSVNRCPLDLDINKRRSDSGDRDRQCPMEKQVRMRIGSKYPALLPFGGLTHREHSAMKYWESVPKEQLDLLRARVEGWNRQKPMQNSKTTSEPGTEKQEAH
jgi:hypothetical protein